MVDRFYLNNAIYYQELVDSFDPTKPIPHFSRHEAAPSEEITTTEQFNPDMIVSARIRPMLEDDLTAGFPRAVYPRPWQLDRAQVIDLHDLHQNPTRRPTLKSSNYRIDRFFDSDATTEEIYDDLLVDVIAFAKQGGIGTLFAYGQTGSGKTFTISRLQALAVSALMDEVSSDSSAIEVYLTICDLAGNAAFDLLDARKPIAILQDAKGVTQLAGATEHRIRAKDEVLRLVDQAAAFRRTAPTLKNDASSRSHSICRIRIRDRVASPGADGLLYLVDLAGSEAARDVAAHGAERMRETREINMSLSVLKDCVRGKAAIAAQRRRGPGARPRTVHVPIRQSTLTRVLKHVFDPQGSRACKTVMIACVNPSLADVGPSKNTLRYAEMLRVPLSAAGN